MERTRDHEPAPSEKIRRGLEVRSKLFTRCGGAQYMPTLEQWFPELANVSDMDIVNLRMEIREAMRGKNRSRAWPYVVKIEDKLNEPPTP